MKSPFFLWLLPVLFLFPVPLRAKTTIGRVEPVTLPAYGITLEARIDTGAHTCSLHVVNQKLIQERDGTTIEFDTVDASGRKFHVKTKVTRESSVKSSTGEATARYVIYEDVQLGGVKKRVAINLNDRTDLRYNFLVGRNFLRGDFVVDVALSHVVRLPRKGGK